jgi:putative endonuclease|tara:strand:- start:308 stop:628 length:321 start_codon:yes stop_codon:yes gene_type:complete
MDTENEEAAQWSLYLIRTAQASLYTGVTTDVQRRFAEHENRDKKNKGAKALRGKGPLKLVFKIVVGNRSDALKLEYKVKKLSRTDKQRLISRTSKLEELITWLQEK